VGDLRTKTTVSELLAISLQRKAELLASAKKRIRLIWRKEELTFGIVRTLKLRMSALAG
jgi:hypothetical protein